MSGLKDVILSAFGKAAAGNLMTSAERGSPGTPVGDPSQFSPVSLAYMGDSVYDLYARTYLLSSSTATVNKLSRMQTKIVCATAQSIAAKRVFPMLTEQEQAIFMRGRNAHFGTTPKSATIAEYRAASALEALTGYLYLTGNDARLNEIMAVAFEGITDTIKEISKGEKT